MNTKSRASNRLNSSSLTGRIKSVAGGTRRRGMAILYTGIAMTAFCGLCSFAVDFGRVEVAKAELRRAADAASRAAAAELPDAASAVSFAKQYATVNTADGTATSLDSSADIEFGKWDRKAATFTKVSSYNIDSANCVHVTLRRTAARGNAVPLLFGKVLGQNFCDVKAESYAMLVPLLNVDQNVPGTANPFLAGMPSGSVASLNNPHKSPDYAGTTSNPRQSPLAVNMPIDGDTALTFDGIDGTVRHDPNLGYFDPDGEMADIGHNTNGSENGISDITAPINALVGVFMDDTTPSFSGAPKSLDFSTPESRDFTTMKPQLKQLFFIGDGKNSSGARQQFIAPKGATRLFLATWDFFEWNNNAGYRNIRVKRPQQIILVK